MPLPFAIQIQSLFSKQSFDTASIRIGVDHPRLGMLPLRFYGRPQVADKLKYTIPVTIDEVSADVEAQPDAFTLTLVGRDGWRWETTSQNVIRQSDKIAATGFLGTVL